MKYRSIVPLLSAASLLCGSVAARAAVVDDTFTGYVDFTYGTTIPALANVKAGDTYSISYDFDTNLGTPYGNAVEQGVQGGTDTSTVSPVLSASFTIDGVTIDFDSSYFGRAQDDTNAVTTGDGRQAFQSSTTYLAQDVIAGTGELPLALDANFVLQMTSPNQDGQVSFAQGGIALDTETFTQTVVAAVPLPSSAPMFGAALLAVGAVGYGLRRRHGANAV